MLSTYPEIRDRIYILARRHGLCPDWVESGRSSRSLLLYDQKQVVVGRAIVPTRHMDPDLLRALEHALSGVFGKGWMR